MLTIKICKNCKRYKLITGWRNPVGNVLQALVEKDDPNIQVIDTTCEDCQQTLIALNKEMGGTPLKDEKV